MKGISGLSVVRARFSRANLSRTVAQFVIFTTTTKSEYEVSSSSVFSLLDECLRTWTKPKTSENIGKSQTCMVQAFCAKQIKHWVVGSIPCNAQLGKEMFYFNDALNTVYLRLSGVGHMVKDHSDSERRNPLPQHGLLFSINSNDSFICIIPQTG